MVSPGFPSCLWLLGHQARPSQGTEERLLGAQSWGVTGGLPQAVPRISSRGSTHTTVARGTALQYSPEVKPRGKASTESHRSLDPREGKRDTAATAWEEIARACPHSRRGLTPLWRLQRYPKIHVSTGEESSGSGTHSTQGLRPRHRRERNPERPPSNSRGDWPFLRPPERVPEDPVLSREHLPQLKKIQEVLHSRRGEAHFS